MAKPIEPTPVLTGRDAQSMLADLSNGCSPVEARARVASAAIELKEMTRRKGPSGRASTG